MSTKVASRIEGFRKRQKWDYRELAKVLGVSVSQAHEWANGEHEPSLKSIRKIARRLGVDLAELIS